MFTCAQFFNFRVAGTKAVIHPGEHVMPGQFCYGDDDNDNDSGAHSARKEGAQQSSIHIEVMMTVITLMTLMTTTLHAAQPLVPRTLYRITFQVYSLIF